MEKENRISVQLDDGNVLVATEGCDPDYKEIYIGIQTPNDDYQSIAVVGEAYTYEIGRRGPVPIHGSYYIMAYEDPESDDFTKEITVPLSQRLDEPIKVEMTISATVNRSDLTFLKKIQDHPENLIDHPALKDLKATWKEC